LRIALDATYSLDRRLSGVGVYSRELLFGLARERAEADYLFCYRPHRFLRSYRDCLPANCARRLLWNGVPVFGDLFHALNQRVDSRRHRRIVSTFHDLFVLTSEYSTPDFRERFGGQARLAAERSDLIIAVSEFTAGQVRDVLNVEPGRIRVIPHGTRPPAAALSRSRERLILFVGAIQQRKNVARLVEAFEKAAAGWKLVLAGSHGYGAESILSRIEQSPRRADIELPGYVSNQELDELYSRASIFAFPSLDEGFGMPVLDAMMRGVPVLTSNRSALPEVSGDAARLVNPLDTDAIAEGLRALIDDETLRMNLVRKGLEHASQFTWEKAVERTWQVYSELFV
jgi:glycosyltransferase involved in cell wall biosynthesis